MVHVDHYLDDFIIYGPPGSDQCAEQLQRTLALCERLGVPLADEKLEGPTECLTFLRIEIDTSAGVLRLPEDKLARVKSALWEWEERRRCTKRELQSLIGTLPPQDDRSCQDPEAPSSFCSAQYGVSSQSTVVACLCRPLKWSGCDPGHGRPRDRGNIGCLRPLGLRSLEPGELVPV